jgi:hypothetical protein
MQIDILAANYIYKANGVFPWAVCIPSLPFFFPETKGCGQTADSINNLLKKFVANALIAEPGRFNRVWLKIIRCKHFLYNLSHF